MQIKALFREPLLHFFLLGAVLFVVFALKTDDAQQSPDEIIVDTTRIDALATQFERVWKRSPTADELQNLVEQWVREEIFYREGLALGLDRKDSVMRQRVARQMEYISEELLDPTPSPAEVEEWFVKNAEDYRLDPRFSFRQLYLNPAVHGAAYEAQVKEVRQALARGEIPAGDVTLLPAALEDATLSDVRRTFGEEFAQSLRTVAVGEWAGPVASGYGLHFVRVDSMEVSRVPDLDEVRKAVERDFLAERTRELKERVYATLQERYTIVYEDSVAQARVAGDEAAAE